MTTALRDGTAVAEWTAWTSAVRVVVTDPDALPAARTLVEDMLAGIDAAASRFRPDSEVSRLAAGDGTTVRVSAVLADLVQAALCAAADTDGDVDPTFGADLVRLGYDRDLADVRLRSGATTTLTIRRPVTWRDVSLVGRDLRMPVGVLLDLGATAKARAADLCAVAVAERFHCGALVSIGGDLRAAGDAPPEGWGVLVQDGPAEPASRIRLDDAWAVATSSTLHRVWHDGVRQLHHILDPGSRRPSPPVWRTVTVAAPTCVEANTFTTAAMVRGTRAPALLRDNAVAARLVARDGTVVRLGGWPE